MPVYEYKCKTCGEKFEITRGIKEEETGVRCPRCGSSDAKRSFSLFGRGASGDAPIHFG